MEQRILDAIKILKAGHPFRLDDVYMGIDEDDILNVTCLSQCFYLENITKETLPILFLFSIIILPKPVVLATIEVKSPKSGYSGLIE